MAFTPPSPPQFGAFTIKANGGRLGRIISDIGVSLPFDSNLTPDASPQIYETKALWDTGATHSVVSRATAQSLGLKPVSMSRMSHAGGYSDVNVYLVNLYLPNQVTIQTVTVMEMADADGFGVLIGMDIITLGDLSLTNVGGITTFSFRFPSIEAIDYVEEANRIRNMGRPESVVGRNDPCPCGSGRKYKNCHGRQRR